MTEGGSIKEVGFRHAQCLHVRQSLLLSKEHRTDSGSGPHQQVHLKAV